MGVVCPGGGEFFPFVLSEDYTGSVFEITNEDENVYPGMKKIPSFPTHELTFSDLAATR